VLGSEEAAIVHREPRVVEEIALERHVSERVVPARTTLKKTDIRISEAGRSDMNPNYQTPRTSSPGAARVAVVDEGRSALGRASGAAHATSARARSFPVGVLLLLIVLAIALIALIAAIF
jgi:hypothetical protein